ncbi:MAG TPA: DinB family protein [Thermoanaerobaculia bacterium]|jgi:uncharacterized damage-inducible protein DinB
MEAKKLVAQLTASKQYFDRSTECLTEDDSTFAPSDGLMTAAQQVAHVAQTVDWFFEGAFRPEGFDLDFAGHAAEVAKVSSLTAAREWLDRAFGDAEKALVERAGELAAPIAEGPVMGGQPRAAIVGAIADHTSHHRGALTVYSRLRGHVPAMPYM